MGTFSPTPVQEEPSRQWLAIVGGALVLVALVAALVFFSRPSQTAAGPDAHPYSEQLNISDLALSSAENFVGATVHYIEGKIANLGNQTVTECRVEVVFRNSLGEVVQTDRMPLQVVQPSSMGDYLDVTSLRASPLGPGQAKTFRLTFEHISSDWNRGYPEVRVLSVKTQ